MTKSGLEILGEFNDDIEVICQALIEAREELDKKDEEIETLNEEIEGLEEELSSHECKTE